MRRLLIVAATLLAAPAMAADWTFSPSISGTVEYSDNLLLRPNGRDRKGSAIFEISPVLELSRQSERWQLDGNYRLEAVHYQQQGLPSEVLNYLSLNSRYMFVPQTFGVLANATIDQQIIDAERPVSFNTNALGNNLTEGLTASIEPFYNLRVGATTTGSLRYRVSVVEFQNPIVPDSKQTTARLALSNPANSLPINWALSFSDQLVEYDFDREVDFRRANAELGIEIGTRTDIVLSGGVEENQIGVQQSVLQDIDGPYWLAGLRGRFGERSSYDIRVGEKFFGRTYAVGLELYSRTMGVRFGYNEEATNSVIQQLGATQLLTVPGGIGGIGVENREPDVFISERFSIDLSYSLNKSSWLLDMFDERRSYLSGGVMGVDDDARTTGVGLKWTWQPPVGGSFNVSTFWRRNEIRRVESSPETFTLRTSFRRGFFEKGFWDVAITHDQRSAAADDGNEYEENRISIGLGYRL